VRAHFSYVAAEDPYIPCKEAGLDFVKGDVLHIVSQDDAYWWDIIYCQKYNLKTRILCGKLE